MRSVLACLFAMFVSGCATTLSEVTVFHDLPAATQPLKYASRQYKHQEGSLEHKSYENLVKAELNKRGYVETSARDADVYVFLYYGMTGQEVSSSYPIYGQIGSSNTTTNWTYKSNEKLPTFVPSTPPPRYGVVGTGTSSKTVFGSYLFMDFLDPADFNDGKIKKLYEAKVVQVGQSGALTRAMPEMIKTLFEDFPGTSGSTRRVELPAY